MIPQKYMLRKESLKRAIAPAIIVLVALGAFGLGRLSALPSKSSGLIIHPPGNTEIVAQPVGWEAGTADPSGTSQAAITDTAEPHNYVASSGGTKYYLPTCPGAKSISDANKIYFATALEAQAAGYGPAANCQGLQ